MLGLIYLKQCGRRPLHDVLQSKSFFPVVTVYCWKCIPEALTCICMFYDNFFINLYNFFNQLGLLCSCQKKSTIGEKEFNNEMKLLKQSAMCFWRGKRMCFRKVWEERTTKSAYFLFPTTLNALLSEVVPHVKGRSLVEKVGQCMEKTPPGRSVPRVSESSMFGNGVL